MRQAALSQRWLSAWVVAAGLALAVLVGAATAYLPIAGIALAGVAMGGLLAIPLAHRVDRLFLGALAGLLGGYAFFGRGFAYLGVPPLFVGELVLLLGALALLFGLRRFRLTWAHGLIIAFMLLGLLRTAPFVSRYGIDALRDAVLWIYALYALAVSTLLRPQHLERFVRLYRLLVPAFVVWVPISAATALGWLRIPPPIGTYIYFKGGDMGVHLAGVGAFILVGLFATRRGSPITEALLWPFWFLAVAVAGTINRGGLVAVALSLATVFALRGARKWFPFVAVATSLVVGALIVNPAVDIGQGKTLSVGQIASNLVSVVAPSEDVPARLAGTREWRIEWWSKIVDYTVHGPYFWTGKGFGINLGLSDRISIEEAVRSPHNGHMTVLARMGVPGFVLWLTLWAAFAAAMLRRIVAAQRAGSWFTAAVATWLFTYWLAMMVNASFDVYLEGPQGGIWFWSVVGASLALLRIDALTPPAPPEPAEPPALAPVGLHARPGRP